MGAAVVAEGAAVVVLTVVVEVLVVVVVVVVVVQLGHSLFVKLKSSHGFQAPFILQLMLPSKFSSGSSFKI